LAAAGAQHRETDKSTRAMVARLLWRS
jgi:hypothetical protein